MWSWIFLKTVAAVGIHRGVPYYRAMGMRYDYHRGKYGYSGGPQLGEFWKDLFIFVRRILLLNVTNSLLYQISPLSITENILYVCVSLWIHFYHMSEVGRNRIIQQLKWSTMQFITLGVGEAAVAGDSRAGTIRAPPDYRIRKPGIGLSVTSLVVEGTRWRWQCIKWSVCQCETKTRTVCGA